MELKHATLAQLYKEVIEQELGLVTHTDEDGDVVFFKYPELGGFFIPLDEENDPEYMSLVFPKFFNLEKGLNRQQLLELSNQINANSKCIKIVIENSTGALNIMVNMLVAGPDEMPTKEHLSAILPRMIHMIEHALREFASAANREQQNAPAEMLH